MLSTSRWLFSLQTFGKKIHYSFMFFLIEMTSLCISVAQSITPSLWRLFVTPGRHSVQHQRLWYKYRLSPAQTHESLSSFTVCVQSELRGDERTETVHEVRLTTTGLQRCLFRLCPSFVVSEMLSVRVPQTKTSLSPHLFVDPKHSENSEQ